MSFPAATISAWILAAQPSLNAAIYKPATLNSVAPELPYAEFDILQGQGQSSPVVSTTSTPYVDSAVAATTLASGITAPATTATFTDASDFSVGDWAGFYDATSGEELFYLQITGIAGDVVSFAAGSFTTNVAAGTLIRADGRVTEVVTKRRETAMRVKVFGANAFDACSQLELSLGQNVIWQQLNVAEVGVMPLSSVINDSPQQGLDADKAYQDYRVSHVDVVQSGIAWIETVVPVMTVE